MLSNQRVLFDIVQTQTGRGVHGDDSNQQGESRRTHDLLDRR
jgi:hypothetical protein